MALTLQQKVDIRRHLMVPFAGLANSGFTMGVRTNRLPGQLEYYINNLQLEEECVLIGYPYGSIILGASPPTAGQTVTATINGTPVTYTVTAADVAAPLPLQNIANNFANAINVANLGVLAAGGQLVSQPANMPVGVILPSQAQTTIRAKTTFTLTVGQTGNLWVFLDANGSTYPNPQISYTVAGAQTSVYGYIPICNFLENAFYSSSQDLDLFSAGGNGQQAGIRLRQDEPKVRWNLYKEACYKLGQVLSVGDNPWGFPQGGSGVRVS